VPDRGRRPGSLEVCSHLHITEGIELVIEPTRAGLSPEQLRSFVRSVMLAYETVQALQSPPNT
jgi:hypothetical protein